MCVTCLYTPNAAVAAAGSTKAAQQEGAFIVWWCSVGLPFLHSLLWEALAAVCTSLIVKSQTETDRCTAVHPRYNEVLSHIVQENQAPGKVAIADNHKGKVVLCRLTCNLLVLAVVSDGDVVWRLVVLACACHSLIAQWMDDCAAICF